MRFNIERFKRMTGQIESILKKTVVVLSLLLILLQLCHHYGFLERSDQMEGILYQREAWTEQLNMRLELRDSG